MHYNTPTDRLLANWRFYIPAGLAIFFALPGTVSALHGNAMPSAPLGLNLVLLLPFFVILISALGRHAKMFFGIVLCVGVMFSQIAIVRGVIPPISVMFYVFDKSILWSSVPLLLAVIILSKFERRKRSLISKLVAPLLIFPIYFFAYETQHTLGDRRWLVIEDVAERFAQQEFWSPDELVNQCHLNLPAEFVQQCVETSAPLVAMSACSSETGMEGKSINDCYHFLAPQTQAGAANVRKKFSSLRIFQ